MELPELTVPPPCRPIPHHVTLLGEGAPPETAPVAPVLLGGAVVGRPCEGHLDDVFCVGARLGVADACDDNVSATRNDTQKQRGGGRMYTQLMAGERRKCGEGAVVGRGESGCVG